jgi:flagellar biosynthesis/type III secretory pathway M-ring protein FliF/YscJ
MPLTLTLNQVLLLVLTFAAVVVAVVLVRLFAQLRRTAAEGEKALTEMRVLAQHLTELDLVVKDKVETLGTTLEASKKAAVNIGQASALITSKFIKPSSSYLPLIIPVARFVLKRMNKKKEK